MSSAGDKQQIRLTVFDNEPLAQLAEQRLHREDIPCVVRSLGAGSGGWGVATNLPHAIYVRADDQVRARRVLDLAPAEVAERRGPRPGRRLRMTGIVLFIITAAAVLAGVLELLLIPR